MQSDSLRPVVSTDHGLAFGQINLGMPQPLVTMTTFDGMLMLRDTTDGLVGAYMYKPHLFSVQAIDRLLRDFQQVLEHMVMQPERPISLEHMVMQPERPISLIAVSPNEGN